MPTYNIHMCIHHVCSYFRLPCTQENCEMIYDNLGTNTRTKSRFSPLIWYDDRSKRHSSMRDACRNKCAWDIPNIPHFPFLTKSCPVSLLRAFAVVTYPACKRNSYTSGVYAKGDDMMERKDGDEKMRKTMREKKTFTIKNFPKFECSKLQTDNNNNITNLRPRRSSDQ